MPGYTACSQELGGIAHLIDQISSPSYFYNSLSLHFGRGAFDNGRLLLLDNWRSLIRMANVKRWHTTHEDMT